MSASPAFASPPPSSPLSLRELALKTARKRGWLVAPGALAVAESARAALLDGVLPDVKLLPVVTCKTSTEMGDLRTGDVGALLGHEDGREECDGADGRDDVDTLCGRLSFLSCHGERESKQGSSREPSGEDSATEDSEEESEDLSGDFESEESSGEGSEEDSEEAASGDDQSDGDQDDVDGLGKGLHVSGWSSAEEDADEEWECSSDEQSESCEQTSGEYCEVEIVETVEVEDSGSDLASEESTSVELESPSGEEGGLKGSRHWLLAGSFEHIREESSELLLKYFDDKVIGGRLLAPYGEEQNAQQPFPPRLSLRWNKRLYKTAGCTTMKRPKGLDVRLATIELSVKVLDCPERLYNTLAHELCHAAAWILDGVAKPPHGANFKAWAQRFRDWDPFLVITTRHSYEIHYQFTYRCTSCSYEYGRHSRSININTQACGVCKGKLELVKNKR